MSNIRIAVISDIHGNVDALKAVLNDIESQKIDTIVNLGDHLSGPLAAQETYDLIQSASIVSIQGNHDRQLVDTPSNRMSDSDKTAHNQIDHEVTGWLGALPASLSLDSGIFLCHGTPTSDLEYWLETVLPTGQVVLRDMHEIISYTRDINASLFLCGHTHIPRIIEIDNGRLIVNPGSVGLPAYEGTAPHKHIIATHSTTANYAIVERTSLGWDCTFRNIPYNTARMISLARENLRDDWVQALSKGRISHLL